MFTKKFGYIQTSVFFVKTVESFVVKNFDILFIFKFILIYTSLVHDKNLIYT
jgi:hypothetical protein